MCEETLKIALAYYEAINNQDLAGVEKLYHPDIELFTPLAKFNGKESALEAIQGFMSAINRVRIRSHFASDDQVMLANDIEFPEPIGVIRAAVLMTIKDNLITSNELIYDTRAKH